MADINVERKGPSIWPWIVGLLVLALLIWAIAEMVDTDEAEMAEVEEVEEPAAALPAPSAMTAEGEAQVMKLEDLLPLGPEDTNARAGVIGEVVGQPTTEGFWVLTDADHVIFVMSDQRPSTGQSVNITGTLLATPEGKASSWANQAKLREAAGWTVHRDLHLHAAAASAQAQPGVQQQPGMQRHGQPGERQY